MPAPFVEDTWLRGPRTIGTFDPNDHSRAYKRGQDLGTWLAMGQRVRTYTPEQWQARRAAFDAGILAPWD